MSNELSITRIFPAPRAVIWQCWTDPKLLQQWYCPKPWRVTEVDQRLEVGGRANVVMEGPAGERHAHKGCYLEVVPMQRLAFTDAYTEGFIPTEKPFMTGYVVLSDTPDGGTRMVWGARHWTKEARDQHETMGFEQGWNAAADQLGELAKQLAAAA